MNKFIIVLTMVICCVFGKAQSPITIDPNSKEQTVKGWGTSLAWWANIAGGWSEEEIDWITQKAAVELNMNVFRFNIGGGENPNCPHGTHIRADGRDMPGYRHQQADQSGWGIVDTTEDWRQIKLTNYLAKWRAPENDMITEMFSNSPPWWMTNSTCVAGSDDGLENLNPNFADDFADYLVSVTAELNTAHPEWNISYIEPFNEPLSTWWTSGGSQEGCYFHPNQQAPIISYVADYLNNYGLSNIGIAAPDCNTVGETIWNTWYLWNSYNAQYNLLTKFNTHSYVGTWQEKEELYQNATNSGHKVWQSESGPLFYTPSDGSSWYQGHYMMAYRLIEDMRNLRCEVWCDWQFMSVDDGWAMVQLQNFNGNDPYASPTLVQTKGFYCRQQVTNHILQGYQIIQTNDGNTLAAMSPDSSEAVLVVVNQSGSNVDYQIDLSSFDFVKDNYTVYRTSGSDNVENHVEKTANTIDEKGVRNGDLIDYRSPAYSVTTFIFNLSAPIYTTDLVDACDSYTWMDGNSYTSNTTAPTYIIENQNGSDTIVQLHLTVHSLAATITDAGNVLTASPSGNNYQWVDCDNAYQLIDGAIEQTYTATSFGNFAAIVSDGACIDTTDCVFVSATSLSTIFNQESIKISPNPSSNGIFQIQYAGKIDYLEVFDQTGRKVAFEYSNNLNQIDLSGLSNGVYHLRAYGSEEGVYSKVLILER